jgi:hydrogenase maturation factor
MIPAPRKPIPEIICAAILEVEFGSTKEDRNVKIMAPPITRQWVLIPAGFPLDSLSAPIAKPEASAMPMSIKNRSSYPVGMFSKTNLSRIRS